MLSLLVIKLGNLSDDLCQEEMFYKRD